MTEWNGIKVGSIYKRTPWMSASEEARVARLGLQVPTDIVLVIAIDPQPGVKRARGVIILTTIEAGRVVTERVALGLMNHLMPPWFVEIL